MKTHSVKVPNTLEWNLALKMINENNVIIDPKDLINFLEVYNYKSIGFSDKQLKVKYE